MRNPATDRGPPTKQWEQRVRNYAAHLALRVTGRDGVFTLSERYGGKKKIGTYRSVETLRRAIVRQHDRMLEELGAAPAKKRKERRS